MDDQPTPKGRATRGRILEAAAQVMSEAGVAAATQSEVEKAAGVGRSQLYHYFPDRQSLIRSVVERNGRAMVTATRAALTDHPGLAGFDRWFDRATTANQSSHGVGGCPLGSLASQLAEADEATRALCGEMFSSWQEPVLDQLKAMQAGGHVRDDVSVERLADQIMAMMQGGLLLAQIRRDPAQLATALSGARQLIVDACVPL